MNLIPDIDYVIKELKREGVTTKDEARNAGWIDDMESSVIIDIALAEIAMEKPATSKLFMIYAGFKDINGGII